MAKVDEQVRVERISLKVLNKLKNRAAAAAWAGWLMGAKEQGRLRESCAAVAECCDVDCTEAQAELAACSIQLCNWIARLRGYYAEMEERAKVGEDSRDVHAAEAARLQQRLSEGRELAALLQGRSAEQEVAAGSSEERAQASDSQSERCARARSWRRRRGQATRRPRRVERMRPACRERCATRRRRRCRRRRGAAAVRLAESSESAAAAIRGAEEGLGDVAHVAGQTGGAIRAA